MGNVLCCVDHSRNYANGDMEDYGDLAQDTSDTTHFKAV